MVTVSRTSLGLLLVVVIALGSLWFYFLYMPSPSSTDARSVTVVFHILDQGSHKELTGVNVEINGHSRTSAIDGDVQFVTQPGTYTAIFEKSGCVNLTRTFNLTEDRRITVAMAKAPPSTGTYTLAFYTSDGQISKPEFRVRADGVFYSQDQRGRYDRGTLTIEAVAPAGWKFSRWGFVVGYYLGDKNRNPIVIEVKNDGAFEALFQPTGIVPAISMSPTGLSTGDIYTITGSGFTAYGLVYINAWNPGGKESEQEAIYADNAGKFSDAFTMRCTESGTYRALDDMTGLTSNDANFTITTPTLHSFVLAWASGKEAGPVLKPMPWHQLCLSDRAILEQTTGPIQA